MSESEKLDSEKKESEESIKDGPKKKRPGRPPARGRRKTAAQKRGRPARAKVEVDDKEAAQEEKSVSEDVKISAEKKEVPPSDVQEENKDTGDSDTPKSSSGKRKSSRGEKGSKQSAKTQSSATEEKKARSSKQTRDNVVQKLLINAEEPEECRIALVENGRLEAFHVTSVIREQTKNNIYKGRITAIEPNLQAVFVDIGQKGKNGFLPFSEIHPEYFRNEASANKHWKDLNIQEELKKGQELLVQVVKEATGTKGANMTTYLSLPGRFLVLMPGSDSAGISRKIQDEKQRSRLREIMNSFSIPEGVGYIIRTASDKITKTALSKDLLFLVKQWKEIKKRGQEMEAPALIYKDQTIIAKFLRDHFTDSIKEILVDSQDAYDQVNSFLELLPARQRKVKVKLHQGSRPILNYYDVEEQIEQIYQPTVKLPSGGSIVINPTEALVAIDVNSGRTSKDQNFDETIFLANKEAARELARQLRLRDLGGLIVVDFIDMRNAKHVREVEKELKAAMKRDKAKISTSRISKFGLLQISRQKIAAPIQLGSYKVCEHCHGRGVVKSIESLALYYLRRIQTGVVQKKVKRVVCRFPVAVAQYLLNNKRSEILELERQYDSEILIEPTPEMRAEDHLIEFVKS
jgi:ribonuclease E